MSVLTTESPRRTPNGPASFVGYRVFGPEGWIGTVTGAYEQNCMLVRTGLFQPRCLAVLPADIERVNPAGKTMTLQRDPRDFVAPRPA